jgi:hypothetical protein
VMCISSSKREHPLVILRSGSAGREDLIFNAGKHTPSSNQIALVAAAPKCAATQLPYAFSASAIVRQACM